MLALDAKMVPAFKASLEEGWVLLSDSVHFLLRGLAGGPRWLPHPLEACSLWGGEGPGISQLLVFWAAKLFIVGAVLEYPLPAVTTRGCLMSPGRAAPPGATPLHPAGWLTAVQPVPTAPSRGGAPAA